MGRIELPLPGPKPGALPLRDIPRRGPRRIRTDSLLGADQALCQLELAAHGRRDGPPPSWCFAMEVSTFWHVHPLLPQGGAAHGRPYPDMRTARQGLACGRFPASHSRVLSGSLPRRRQAQHMLRQRHDFIPLPLALTGVPHIHVFNGTAGRSIPQTYSPARVRPGSSTASTRSLVILFPGRSLARLRANPGRQRRGRGGRSFRHDGCRARPSGPGQQEERRNG